MPISDRTRKLLWGRAGNRCVMCQRPLIAPESAVEGASIVGDECHIISKAPGGPRHDPYYSGDADDYDNLLLLCKADHKLVDDQSGTYTVEKLKTLKAQHEAAVDAAVAGLAHGPSARVAPSPPQPTGFDNFRTTVFFVPDQDEAVLERFQQLLIRDPRLEAYGRVGTGYKPAPAGRAGRHASWIQAFLPVSAQLLRNLASEVGVSVLDVGHQRLPGIYRAGPSYSAA